MPETPARGPGVEVEAYVRRAGGPLDLDSDVVIQTRRLRVHLGRVGLGSATLYWTDSRPALSATKSLLNGEFNAMKICNKFYLNAFDKD